MENQQESFWKGEFGNDYIDRNKSDQLRASNLAFFSQILSHTADIDSVLELGANIGLNLEAIGRLNPSAKLDGVEINEAAFNALTANPFVDEAHLDSIIHFAPSKSYDLVFTKTVLIHIAPEALNAVYDVMYKASNRYLLVAEYYNPAPVDVMYRGHQQRLFKRDFAGELMKRHQDLRLLEYGFVYHGDTMFPQDDITWFLMERTSPAD